MFSLLILMSAQAAAPESGRQEALRKSGEIASRPAYDVGAKKREIPATLQAAANNPYSLNGLATCRQINGAIAGLTAVLGPDFAVGQNRKENKAGKIAEAGGKTLVNTIIPFRGLVREISGAAPAERQLAFAVKAGFARRGYLRGVAFARNCPGAAK